MNIFWRVKNNKSYLVYENIIGGVKLKKLISAILVCFMVTMLLPTNANAAPTMTVEQTYSDISVTKYWAKVERIRLNESNIVQEKFIDDNAQSRPDIVTEFGGNAKPNSQLFLLHYASGWNTGTKPYPILLVHGAGSSGDFFADPEGDNSVSGLMQSLNSDGYKVFALTYAHPHGDNYFQREILAAAIQRIKTVTGASKVDVIAHSKGNMSARMYVSNVMRSWGTPYRQDVRRYIQLGAPNGGIDYTFRNTWAAWGIMSTGAFGPVPYTDMMIYGLWIDTAYHSIYSANEGGGAYTGQAQMLARWDNTYSLDIFEQDWYTTYYGGWGYYSYSYGIDYSISQGGNLIALLQKSPVDSNVQIATLAGNYNVINGVVMEDDGPSDGLIFVDSATMTGPMTSSGATLLAKTVMNLNHVELAYDPDAISWIKTQLTR